MTTNIKKQQKLSDFVSREVYVNQTMLIGELMKDDKIELEDVKNYFKTDKELKDNGYKTKKERKEARDNGEDVNEIYEWWAVSGWLLDKLEAKGAPVLRTDLGEWWGRTTTGQAISMDWVIEQIFDDLTT